MQYENRTIKLRMALARGRCHRLADVRQSAFALGAALQAGVERLIDQTAPRLAAAATPASRAALLADGCQQLARAIEAEFTRSAKRLRGGVSSGTSSGGAA